MDGLPFIPGFRFDDITKKNHHLSSQFQWKNGYAIPKVKSIGIGKYPLDVDSTLYAEKLNVTRYNPTLTYGRAKDPPKPIVQSNFIKLDGKCLSFNGYTEVISTEMNTNKEKLMIRRVKITYFLVDDTICVIEPVIKNSGYVQGCLLKRGKIPNPYHKNRNYHWSDFNNGVELSFYGIKYKLCSCDLFTKNFFLTQGIKICPDEPIPYDPYIMNRIREQKNKSMITQMQCTKIEEDENKKLNQFLKYDKKVLRFYAAWYDEGLEPAGWRFYVLYYFLANDKIEIYESQGMGSTIEKIGNSLFLGKIKLPKDRLNIPENFPNICLEVGANAIQKYYQAKDLIIGKTIFVLGRRFLLYDCDAFTRRHYKDILKINQPDPIQVVEPKVSNLKCHLIIPPHTGIGDPDDTYQNCISLIPKPPKTTDFVTYVMDSFKKLRYKLKMVPVIEVDSYRNFLMEYCLGNDQISITEVPMKNSGFLKGRIIAPTRLRKPGTKVEENQFFGPKDFAIGAELRIRGITYKIIDMDLWTYKYMIENKDKFTEEAINGAKQLFETNGFKRSKKNEDLK
ncbi:EF-hand domain-containing protein 1-like [Sipha flava]|uniref:EF-hand domain-containing protein 1-like n=1 Tax=Sipha flava TaxID=143950 RepID=A0A8B8FWS1_9HEMI|nr:EF-hand domain-containing protein 1-like [Sipha flava]